MTTSIPTLRLYSAALAAVLGASAASAQTAAPTSPNATTNDVVEMSSFVVSTTSGLGYVDGNSVSGFKTNQSLLEIPQAELVLTNDFIKDTGLSQLSDIVAYGVAHFYRGNDPMIRGSRDGFPLIDGMIDVNAYEDDYFVDSIEVLKGPAAVLYAGTSLTGTVIKSSKKPLAHAYNSVTGRVDSFGQWRGTIDSTGPVGHVGSVLMLYRVDLAYQAGPEYFANYHWNVAGVHVPVEFDYQHTSVIFAFDYEKVSAPANGNGFLTPGGDLYTGAGYKYSGNWFPNTMENIGHKGLYGAIDQKFSDSWEMKLAASRNAYPIYTGNAVITAENWQTMTYSGIFRENNQLTDAWELTDDIVGKYDIGFIKAQTTAGFAHVDQSTDNRLWTMTRPGLANTFALPMGSAAAINALYVPQQTAGDYPIPAIPGSRSKNYTDQIYLQEQFDPIPNWLSLVVGWAFIQTESVSDTNIAVNTPFTATNVSFHTWAPRLGAILHVAKDVVLYGLDTKTAAVNSAVDINNNRLPDVAQTSEELGLKANLWDGRLVSTVDVYKTDQTNQSVFTGQINAFGAGYYVPVGETVNKGWEFSLALAPVTGFEVIATGYKGTVLNQAGQWVSPAFGNMWSLFMRYDFGKATALKGLSLGGGASRVGQKYLSTGGVTFPVGWSAPSFYKVKAGTDTTAFINYDINRHWAANVNCSNLLDDRYPLGVQSAGIIDPSTPRSFSFSLTYDF